MTFNDLENIYANVAVMNLILKDEKMLQNNSFLRNMAVFQAEQAFEKMLLAKLKPLTEEQQLDAFSKAGKKLLQVYLQKTGIPETSVENQVASYKLSDDFPLRKGETEKDVLPKIKKSHSVTFLLEAVRTFSPAFIRDFPFFELNESEFSQINKSRHGQVAIKKESVELLAKNINGLYRQILDKEERRAVAPKKKAGEEFSIDEIREEIHSQVCDEYSKMDSFVFNTSARQSEPIHEEEIRDHRAFYPRELMLVRANVQVASKILLASKTDPIKKNPYAANIAATHAESAIAEVLRTMVKAIDDDVLSRIPYGKRNNMTYLFDTVASTRPNFKEEHDFLDMNIPVIHEFNSSVRYGEKSVSVSDARALYNIAKTLYNEAMQEYNERVKGNNIPPPQQISQMEYFAMETSSAIQLIDPEAGNNSSKGEEIQDEKADRDIDI